eukprot:CCRYP_016858-RA/>CCRYP_016858-RA protein AED:0.00 eAED:0.00 QI:50/1/1/1/0/0/2/0/73
MYNTIPMMISVKGVTLYATCCGGSHKVVSHGKIRVYGMVQALFLILYVCLLDLGDRSENAPLLRYGTLPVRKK